MSEPTASSAPSQPQDVEREIQQLVGRLRLRFPELPQADIADVITSEYQKLGSVRVRDFLPVLVERRARPQLRDLVRS